MGWNSGSRLMSDVIAAIKENVKSDSDRLEIYTSIITSFEDLNADTLDDCLGEDSAYDEAYYEIHPEHYNLEEDEE